MAAAALFLNRLWLFFRAAREAGDEGGQPPPVRGLRMSRDEGLRTRARLRRAAQGHERGHGNELALLHHVAFREERAMPIGEGEGLARVRSDRTTRS